MIHAYDRMYLDKARNCLGRMLDFVVYDLKYDISSFFELFVKSNISERFASGDFTVLVGMSGVELAYHVLDHLGISYKRVEPTYMIDRSEEYWTGWALAYYQWQTSISFKEIQRYISIKSIQDLYSPYHEMDIQHLSDKLNEMYRNAKPDTNLKIRRTSVGITQSQLADQTGIPVRTIQQYEQRQKDINKAKAMYLVLLARELYCDVEDLIEKC